MCGNWLTYCLKKRKNIENTSASSNDKRYSDANVDKVLSKKNFKLDSKLIGKGSYGHVYRAVRQTDGKVFACKVIRLVDEHNNPMLGNVLSFKRELKEMEPHFNIIQVDLSLVIGGNGYLIMEYASGGSIEEEMQRRGGPYSENDAKNYFSGIANAIDHLHYHDIAHRDLKLENVLICVSADGTKVAKLTDFGTSKEAVSERIGVIKSQLCVGTLPYMSPQWLRLYIKYKLKADLEGKVRSVNPFIGDIWALGVCLYQLICNEYPFPRIDPKSLPQLKSMLMKQNNKNWTIKSNVKNKLSKHCLDIVSRMLEPNRFLRIDITDAVSHPWLVGE